MIKSKTRILYPFYALLVAVALFSVNCKEKAASMEVSAAEVGEAYKEGNAQILDVRTLQEYEGAHIPGSTLVPLQDIYAKAELPFDKESTIYVICRSGNRSKQATQFMRNTGYPNAVSVQGGILAWMQEGLPVKQGGTASPDGK